MPRPSLKDKRIEQILDAYETCIARYGVEAATLERVAAQAGLARPLIRHNVGNRDDLLTCLMERFLEKSRRETHLLEEELPNTGRVTCLIAWLFDPNYMDSNLVKVTNALLAAVPDHPAIAGPLDKSIKEFVSFIAKELQKEHSHASLEAIQDVANGIAGIYFNVESLSVLSNTDPLRLSSRGAALRLKASLKESG